MANLSSLRRGKVAYLSTVDFCRSLMSMKFSPLITGPARHIPRICSYTVLEYRIKGTIYLLYLCI